MVSGAFLIPGLLEALVVGRRQAQVQRGGKSCAAARRNAAPADDEGAFGGFFSRSHNMAPI